MSGSMVIPNVLASQSGNVPATQFDANWNAPATYVNAREITQGTFAARPAAGVSGRWYFATDTGGGTLYEDTGTGWTQMAPGVTQTSSGGYFTKGYTGDNNAGTPNTQRDMVGALVQLRNPTDGTIAVRTNTGTVTNNILTAGSTANGRDQAGAFTNSTFVHFYFIWNGATLSTLSSATAPPTGPTLPSGYTHWAYEDAVFLSGAGALVKTRTRGNWALYESIQTVVTAGTANTEQTQSVSALVPANASRYKLACEYFDDQNNGTTNEAFIRLVTGSNFASIARAKETGIAAIFDYGGKEIEVPNVGQSFIWILSKTITTGTGLQLYVPGYCIGD